MRCIYKIVIEVVYHVLKTDDNYKILHRLYTNLNYVAKQILKILKLELTDVIVNVPLNALPFVPSL